MRRGLRAGLVGLMATIAVLALAVGGAAGADVTAAEGGTTAAAPTGVSSCQVIDTPGEYVLTSAISNDTATTCIEILVSDVTIDGDGYTIDGVNNTSGSVGILVNGTDRTVRNVTIEGGVSVQRFETGIGAVNVEAALTEPSLVVDRPTVGRTAGDGIELIEQDGDARVSNAVVGDIGGIGIEARGFAPSTEIQILDSRINGTAQNGVYANAFDTEVRNVEITDTGTNGIGTISTSGLVSDVTVDDASNVGIFVTGRTLSSEADVTVDNATVLSAGANGINVESEANATVDGSRIVDPGRDGINSDSGDSSEDRLVVQNTVVDNATDIGINAEQTGSIDGVNVTVRETTTGLGLNATEGDVDLRDIVTNRTDGPGIDLNVTNGSVTAELIDVTDALGGSDGLTARTNDGDIRLLDSTVENVSSDGFYLDAGTDPGVGPPDDVTVFNVTIDGSGMNGVDARIDDAGNVSVSMVTATDLSGRGVRVEAVNGSTIIRDVTAINAVDGIQADAQDLGGAVGPADVSITDVQIRNISLVGINVLPTNTGGATIARARVNDTGGYGINVAQTDSDLSISDTVVLDTNIGIGANVGQNNPTEGSALFNNVTVDGTSYDGINLVQAGEGETSLLGVTVNDTQENAIDATLDGGATLFNVAVTNVTPTDDAIDVSVNDREDTLVADTSVSGGNIGIDATLGGAATVDNVSVSATDDDGIRLGVDARNRTTIVDSQVTNVGRQGINAVLDGAAIVDNVSISATGGDGIELDVNAPEPTQLTDISVSDVGMQGIAADVDGSADLDNVTVERSTADGIEIDASQPPLNITNVTIRSAFNGYGVRANVNGRATVESLDVRNIGNDFLDINGNGTGALTVRNYRGSNTTGGYLLRAGGFETIDIRDFRTTGGEDEFEVGFGTNVTIQDGYIENVTTHMGLEVRATNDATVRNVTIVDTDDEGVRLGELGGTGFFEDITVRDTGQAGFEADLLASPEELRIVDSTIENTGEEGLRYTVLGIDGPILLALDETVSLSNVRFADTDGDDIFVEDDRAALSDVVIDTAVLNGSLEDVAVDNATRPAGPSGLATVARFNATNLSTNAFFDVGVRYPALAVVPSSLGVYRYDGSAWGVVSSSTVDTAAREVRANLTTFSPFGVFGQPNSAPGAALSASPDPVPPGDTVTLDASGSSDAEGNVDRYEWDVDGDGTTDRTTTAASITTSYATAGDYTPTVAVIDTAGANDSASATLTVEQPDDTPPQIRSFRATQVPGQSAIRLTVIANEPLGDTRVGVSGPANRVVDPSAFSATGNRSSAVLPVPEDGQYRATLRLAEDEAGNDGSDNEVDTATVDTVPPGIKQFSVTSPEAGLIRIEVASNDTLGDLVVNVRNGSEPVLGTGINVYQFRDGRYVTTVPAPNGSFVGYLDRVEDRSGNRGPADLADSVTVAATGDDGDRGPTIASFDATGTADAARIEVQSDASLGSLTVRVENSSGVVTELDRSAFTAAGSGSLSTRVSFPEPGEYTIRLLSAAGENGRPAIGTGVTVDVTVGGGLPSNIARFDTSGDDQLSVGEIGTAVQAFNDDRQVGGRPVGFSDIAALIDRFQNDG
ncbi:hypothetical protein BRD17_04625 [Halobacteriales archaeon SW_7_68_16]|nr:MAG: hypothetical protein BRD17_04625 [Halobacteriales archaeon SW_7_68_16]